MPFHQINLRDITFVALNKYILLLEWESIMASYFMNRFLYLNEPRASENIAIQVK